MKYYMVEGKLNEGTPKDGAYQKLNYEHHAYIQKYYDAGKGLRRWRFCIIITQDDGN